MHYKVSARSTLIKAIKRQRWYSFSRSGQDEVLALVIQFFEVWARWSSDGNFREPWWSCLWTTESSCFWIIRCLRSTSSFLCNRAYPPPARMRRLLCLFPASPMTTVGSNWVVVVRTSVAQRLRIVDSKTSRIWISMMHFFLSPGHGPTV